MVNIVPFLDSEPISFDANFREPTYHEGLDTLNIARRWLGEYSQNHPECNKKHATILPTRLLYTCEDQIRLVFTSGGQSDCCYVALSHM